MLEMGLDDAPLARYQKESDAAETVPLAGLHPFLLEAPVPHDLPEFDDVIDLPETADEFLISPLVLRVFLEALEFEFLGILFDVVEDLFPIHTIGCESQRVGLHLIFRQDLKGSAGARRDFPLSRAVNNHLA